jgi:hypothetical protein
LSEERNLLHLLETAANDTSSRKTDTEQALNDFIFDYEDKLSDLSSIKLDVGSEYSFPPAGVLSRDHHFLLKSRLCEACYLSVTISLFMPQFYVTVKTFVHQID